MFDKVTYDVLLYLLFPKNIDKITTKGEEDGKNLSIL